MSASFANLLREQEAIRAKCFHPSGTFVEFPIEDVEMSIPARFEKIVRGNATRWAVVSGAQSFSYEDLNSRANREARTIIDRSGVGAEAIALLLDNKATLIMAMLAVLKSGKFYVLLDPTFPKARNRQIIADARAQCVVVEPSTFAFGRDLIDGHCRLLELASTEPAQLTGNLDLKILPDAIASLAYTSGSTGEPKGVIRTHRTMLHQVMLFTNEFHHCHQDRFSYLTSGTSAAVIHPFFGLLVGAAVLPFDVKRQGIQALVTWLNREKVSVCSLSTPLFRSLAASLTGVELFPAMRLLRLSSEAAFKSDFALYRKYFPSHCLLANGVSPAETGLLSTYLMDHGSEIDTHEIPIGYAVQGKAILLMDDSGNEVGLNEVGEIVVRSSYLPQGYWNRPELTAAKFSSLGCDVAERLYRTGDLGLRSSNGCLIHKGRKDSLVKVRGYGVGLGEVEGALRRHPGIGQAVVMDRKEKSGESRLVAYYTSDKTTSPSVSALRTLISETLPDYMVPSAFVRLDSLPLTNNGKIDRGALPDPGNARPNLNSPYAPPATTTEEQLTSIWSEVLSVEQVGIHDNFFDLGGHSLAASRVISRVIQTFKLELPVKALFDAPTVAEMATVITQNQAKRASDQKLAQMLRELEAMTEEEAQRLLDRESKASKDG